VIVDVEIVDVVMVDVETVDVVTVDDRIPYKEIKVEDLVY
jgi:hypothetical protein